METLLCTFQLDQDEVVLVCRVLREHQTQLLAKDYNSSEAKVFARVAHELVEALLVAQAKTATEKE